LVSTQFVLYDEAGFDFVEDPFSVKIQVKHCLFDSGSLPKVCS
jgi:hypothetical protein